MMKTILATLGALALATSAAFADGDGGKARRDFYAVVHGDQRAAPSETQTASTGRLSDIVLRREVELSTSDARRIKDEAVIR